MRVEAVTEPGPEWDAFAEAAPGGTLAHAGAWARVMHEAYGLRPCYLAARDPSGALAGLLPLFRFRTLAGRRELVSMPFLDTGGILAELPEVREALLEAALERCRALDAQALELRQPTRVPDVPVGAAPPRSNLVLRLERAADAQWKALGSKVRNQTRKAEREGLSIGEGSPQELLRDFYTPFSTNMRDLGSPVHAKRFFGAAAQHFGERLRFVVVRDGPRPVGGLVAIRHGGKVTVPWASTLRSERRRCPNNLIYWEALRWAIAGGAHSFDFGRSAPGSGTWDFKRGWGAEDRPLAWVRLSPSGRPLRLQLADESALLRNLSSLWSRLPVAATRALGPRLRRFLAD